MGPRTRQIFSIFEDCSYTCTCSHTTRPFFVVVIDVSGLSCGVVMMQDGHPIAYERRIFKPCEIKYSTYDK